MNRPVRLIIADDHTIVREGIVALLKDEPDFEIAGQGSSGAEAIRLIRHHQPDIALLDIAMGDMTGLDVAHQLNRKTSGVKVIILTMHEDELFFFEALQSGAVGYVLKGSPGAELIRAIRVVFQGGYYLPSQLAGGLVRDYLMYYPQSAANNNDPLTSREKEILILIAQGLTNSGIAKQLTVSVNTVKTHRLNIYQKLNLDNRASLVNYALRQGLLNGGVKLH